MIGNRTYLSLELGKQVLKVVGHFWESTCRDPVCVWYSPQSWILVSLFGIMTCFEQSTATLIPFFIGIVLVLWRSIFWKFYRSLWPSAICFSCFCLVITHHCIDGIIRILYVFMFLHLSLFHTNLWYQYISDNLPI